MSGSGSEATESWWHRHVTRAGVHRSRGGVEKKRATDAFASGYICSIKTNEMSNSTISTEKPQKGTRGVVGVGGRRAHTLVKSLL